jgi:DNA-binding SARP family transcriptional activator/GAF domain-containing protein
LSEAELVRAAMRRVEIVETVLLPPVWLHFISIVADVRRWRKISRVILGFFYVAGVVLAFYALFSPDMDLSATSPRFPALLVVPSVFQRALPLLISLVLVVRSYRRVVEDVAERRRRAFFAIATIIAVSGALVASAAREAGFSQAPGHVMMDTGLAMMAYMVFAYRLLLPARVAQRAFYRSLLGSVLTAVFILLVLLVEPLVGRALAVEAPLVTILALVVLMALFGPLRDAGGAWLDRRFFHREFDYGRLLRAVSDDLFERGDLTGQLNAALAAICRTLRVRSGAVAVQEGRGLRVLATYGSERLSMDALHEVHVPEHVQSFHGDWPAWPVARLLLPLRRAEETLGLLVLGPKRSDEPFDEVERVLLDSLGRYLTLAIKHARTQQEEELAMAALAEQSRQLQAEQALLEAQADEIRRVAAESHAQPVAPVAKGMQVAALGPLRVERDGVMIERWGGDKAGNYQAEALFAFLFDRRGKGLTKDEAEEVIWPDLAMEKSDTAFHRTLSGLRRTLEPGLKRGNESRTITYHHERYWLDPASIGWCDIDEFARAIERGQTQLRQGDLEAARESFEQAVALYRGDYMDDCPFFGDSTYVEERREDLRAQQIDALLALGAVYERLERVGEAATVYRRALAVSHDDCPRAEDGLERLQLV